MSSSPDTSHQMPEDHEEIESYISQLEERQYQEAIFSRITAGFNTATNEKVVLQTLRNELHDLGYKYLSIFEKKGEKLFWHLETIELPKWLTNSIPDLVAQYIQEHQLDFWVPLESENVFSNCYKLQIPQTTQYNDEIIECLHIGETTYNDLPGWLKRAGKKLITRLDVQEHNAFPLGEFGILFLSNPKTIDTHKQKSWVQIILQQAEVALTRIQTIEELKNSKARYQALFNRTNDAIFIISLDMVHLSVNQQAADMLDYTIDELVGMHASQIVAPEEWQNTQNRKKILDRGEIPPLFRRTFIKKDGTKILAEVSVAMVYDNQGNPSHYQSIARDITEREKIQEQLHLQSTALETAANGIMITNKDGTILWVNEAITDLTGYKKDELIGSTPRLFNSKNQSPAFYKHLWERVSQGHVWHGEIINKQKNGTLYTEEMTITPVLDSKGEITNFIAIKQDISDRVQAKEMLEYLATHDSLTDLANRSLFIQRLENAIARAKRYQKNLAVLFIDLDDFKSINDLYGHEIGDEVLKTAAGQLATSIRESDTAARFGGDEFIVLLENIGERKNADMLAQKITDSLSNFVLISGHAIPISASIGVSLYPEDGQDAKTLMSFSDKAMYSAKNFRKQEGY
jgi:diguanylate cyclase (GGDEF)-like protein/PAS domain S-box-containing protein